MVKKILAVLGAAGLLVLAIIVTDLWTVGAGTVWSWIIITIAGVLLLVGAVRAFSSNSLKLVAASAALSLGLSGVIWLVMLFSGPVPDASIDGSDSSTATTTPAITVPPTTSAPVVPATPANGQDDQQDTAASDAAPYEEVGPGQAVPGDQILADLRSERPNGDDFEAPYSDREIRVLGNEFKDYLIANSNDPNVKAMARSIGVAGVDNGVELAAWLDDNAVLRPTKKGNLRVLNTYFSNGNVVDWKVQTFPKNELFWVHEVNGELAPLFKFICGNVIKPAPAVPVAPAPVAPEPVTPAPVAPVEEAPEPTEPVAPTPIPPVDTPDEECPEGQTGTYPDCETPEEPPASCEDDDSCPEPSCEDTDTCETPHEPKPDQTDTCMQNGGEDCPTNEVVQEPQDNDTSGIDVGPTPGAPTDAPPVNDGPSDGPHAGDNTSTSDSDLLGDPTNDPVSQSGVSDSDNGYNDATDSGVVAMPAG